MNRHLQDTERPSPDLEGEEGAGERYWKLVRQMLDHENTIMSNRVGWLTATQAFLLAALGAFWDDSSPIKWVLALAGFASCTSIGLALHHADRSIWALVAHWSAVEVRGGKEMLPPIYGLAALAPRDRRGKRPTHSWLYPWNTMPWTFAFCWIVVAALLVGRP